MFKGVLCLAAVQRSLFSGISFKFVPAEPVDDTAVAVYLNAKSYTQLTVDINGDTASITVHGNTVNPATYNVTPDSARKFKEIFEDGQFVSIDMY